MLEFREGDKCITIIYDDADDQAHLKPIIQALKIYSGRRERYQSGWRRLGALGNAFFMKDRANRVWEALKNGPGCQSFNYEDCVDMINIAAFCYRSAHEENYGGEFWPDA